MNAGEIGTEAGRIFEYNLPSSWIFRSQEDQNDFGIDGEVELKDKLGKAIGNDSVFKVQIKGEENSKYIDNGKILSFTLKIERLRYYFNFKIPVILVVVEVSSDKVYWLPITNDENLRNKVTNSSQNESIQVHLPAENVLMRRDERSANKILNSVTECWDYLSIKGLKESTERFQTLNDSFLSKKIKDIGEVLFKANHQELSNLLLGQDYNGVFKISSEIFSSPIVPPKDQFVALLFYWKAFQISPYTRVDKEILIKNIDICAQLIKLARQQKSKVHRLIAIGKSRNIKFKLKLDKLQAVHHTVNNFEKNSFEHVIFYNEAQKTYRECCKSLQKIIDLCNRLIKAGQYDVLSQLFIDNSIFIILFRNVHTVLGMKESIDFLELWFKKIISLVLTYFVIMEDVSNIEFIYSISLLTFEEDKTTTVELRKIVVSKFPKFEDILSKIEQNVLEMKEKEHKDFYSISIDEQKAYFIHMAKDLGMDPYDPENEFGQIVDIGLKNYDPSDIMKNCESLFVHYRPGGLIAESLRMHSVGGMHLLVCLKHGYAQGTGGLLASLYDGSSGLAEYSFKKQYCDRCSSCKPRSENWSWTLQWYESAEKQHREFLSKYRF